MYFSFDLSNDLDNSIDNANYINNLLGIQQNSLAIPPTLIEEDTASQRISSNADAPFILNEPIYSINSLIIGIMINAKTIGTLDIYTIKRINAIDGQPFNYNDFTLKETLNVTNTGVQIIKFKNPFILPDDEYLAVASPNSTCRFYFGTGYNQSFLYRSHNTETDTYIHKKSSYINIAVIYKDMYLINDDSIFKKVSSILQILNLLNINETLILNGRVSTAKNIANINNAPYFLQTTFNYDYYITKINFKTSTSGTISFGVIDPKDLTNNKPENLNIQNIQTTTVYSEGEHDIIFDEPLLLKKGWRLMYYLPSDSAKIIYHSGTPADVDHGFLFYNATSKTLQTATSSLNLILYGIKSTNDDTTDSIYKDKAISILGDSISTFSGYIPEGNAVYYPSGTITSVSDTWWKKLIDALGANLEINNSWSGSRVTTTAGETSAGCMDRCENLGNPDAIIIYMGINDFNNEVPIGEYDGTSTIPESTITFREAYAIMLNKVLTKYQFAEIWVCTLPQCERNSETGFPEINQQNLPLYEYNKAIVELANAFGVKILDHNKCGMTYQNMPTFNPDKLHPNKNGHSLMANNAIKQMDPSIKFRYPIS